MACDFIFAPIERAQSLARRWLQYQLRPNAREGYAAFANSICGFCARTAPSCAANPGTAFRARVLDRRAWL